MKLRVNKKIVAVTVLCMAILIARAYAQKEHHDEPAKNLKVLDKSTSGEELHKIMRGYSLSLGVRCNFCHVATPVEGQEHPRMDFAADDKPEKNIARDMMKMTAAINENYINKIGDHKLQQVTCVTCHMGSTKPLAMVDSLKKPAGN